MEWPKRELPKLKLSPGAFRILNYLYGTTVSRADISHALGFNPGTVTRAVNELMAAGLIEQLGPRASSGGRPAILLRVNPDYGYVIGVDIGGYTVKIGICNFAGEVVYHVKYPSRSFMPEQLPELVTKVMAERKGRCIGIGVGISGMVTENGHTVFCPNLKGWDDLPITDMLAEATGRPVFLDTSARALAQAETWFGSPNKETDLIYVSVGYSIGAGILISGRVFRGSTGFAGELGHITVTDDMPGLRCTCGNEGCLELIAPLGMIAYSTAQRLMKENGVYSPLRIQVSKLLPTDRPVEEQNRALWLLLQEKPELIQNAAAQGDKIVLPVIGEVAYHLGVAVANMANLFSPRLVVLGGGTLAALPILVDEVMRVVRARTVSPIQKFMEVRPTALGETGPIIGAGTLVFEQLLQRHNYPPTPPHES
ncbi:MAG TPA: ROK family transcriptional regulator [Firmicutes bacterium]|nr:ROK family transcriptional regulator [Bacillota bacterium]